MLLREAKEMIRRFLPILLCLLLLSSFSGVYATWYYTTDRVNPEQKNLMVSINGFDQSINTDRWRSSQAYHGVKSGSTLENVIKGYKTSI